jgi:RNA polymerase sigma-70 factor (sigma-E family)
VDDDGFAEVFRLHSREAVGLAYLLCGDRQRAEDAVSEAFARMYARWGSGAIRDPRAYLRRAVLNEVRNGFRRRFYERREATRRHADDRGAQGHDDAVGDRDHVARLLAQIPERQRTALVLRFHADLTEAQAAEVLGCPVGTLKSLTSRGLARLRELQAAQLTNGGAR